MTTINRPSLKEIQDQKRQSRNDAVIADYNDGLEIPELMVKHGLTRPTAYRIIREARKVVDTRD